MTMSLYHVSHVVGGSLLGPSTTTYFRVVAPSAARALEIAATNVRDPDGRWQVEAAGATMAAPGVVDQREIKAAA